MSTKQKSSRIDALKKEADEIAKKIKALEAEQKAQDRKDETRRKLLTGSVVIRYVDQHPDNALTASLMQMLDADVRKPSERELLGLPPL